MGIDRSTEEEHLQSIVPPQPARAEVWGASLLKLLICLVPILNNVRPVAVPLGHVTSEAGRKPAQYRGSNRRHRECYPQGYPGCGTYLRVRSAYQV